MAEQELQKRNMTCFVQSFLEATSELPVPPIFREWCAISTIAGVLQRKVWFHARFGELFPTNYVLLVAPPGGGKSTVIKFVNSLWKGLNEPNIHTFSGDATKAALIDRLAQSVVSIQKADRAVIYTSLNIGSPEFGNLMKSNDREFLNFFNDIWDCGESYEESRRSRDDQMLEIPNPQINLLGGTQPSYLSHIMPDQSFELGFPSRCLMVFSNEEMETEFLPEEDVIVDHSADLRSVLGAGHDSMPFVRELRVMNEMYGQYVVEKSTRELWSLVNKHSEPGYSLPDMAKLSGYKKRRVSHIAKACMCVAAGRRNERIVKMEDLEYVIDLVQRTECNLPSLIKDMAQDTDKGVMDDCWNYVMEIYKKTNAAVSEHLITAYLGEKVSAGRVRFIMESMLAAYMLQEAPPPPAFTKSGTKTPSAFARFKHYIPLTRQQRGIAS